MSPMRTSGSIETGRSSSVMNRSVRPVNAGIASAGAVSGPGLRSPGEQAAITAAHEMASHRIDIHDCKQGTIRGPPRCRLVPAVTLLRAAHPSYTHGDH